MTCLQAREHLAEFVMDTLPARQHREVERHLQWCHGCRKEVAELQEGLAGAALALPIVEPPPSLEDGVVAKVSEASGRWRVKRRRSVRILAVAALTALLLAVGSLTWGLAMRHQVQSLRSRDSANTTTLETIAGLANRLRAGGKALSATLAPTKGFAGGGGSAMIVTAPNEPDLFMIQVIIPHPAEGPFEVLLQQRSGRTIRAGRLTHASNGVYMLAAGGGFRQFPQTLTAITSVLVLDGRGGPVLTGDVRPYSNP